MPFVRSLASSAIRLAIVEPHLLHESGSLYLRSLTGYVDAIDAHSATLLEGELDER